MRTIDKLIENLGRGLDRAEDPCWVAAMILADENGMALLDNLKEARDFRNAARGRNEDKEGEK